MLLTYSLSSNARGVYASELCQRLETRDDNAFYDNDNKTITMMIIIVDRLSRVLLDDVCANYENYYLVNGFDVH